MSFFDKAFERTIVIEKGYVFDKDDKGGETNFGITVALARFYGYTGPMKDMSISFAKTVYEKEFWEKNKLEQIALIGSDIAIDLFDAMVNCGSFNPAKWIQTGLNTLNRQASLYPNIIVDGVIGKGTIEALKQLPKSDIDCLHKIIGAMRVCYYVGLNTRDESQEKFIRGWLNRVRFQ